MVLPTISRRNFSSLIGTGLTIGALDCVAYAAPSSIRVAAIQMAPELANVEANLLQAERLIRRAFATGARWVILPELFTSGIAFHPEMAKAVRAVDGTPAQFLRQMAREGQAYVGGSFLAWRDGNAYNSFVLAFPDGATRRHDKDYPSLWENCYYVGGSDDGILSTPDGTVGAALCYEFCRTGTAARLKGKVGLVVGGSCWWGLEDSAPQTDPMRKWLLETLQATPGRFARLLGVPVVFASHAGRFEGLAWPGKPVPFPSSYLGESRIVNGQGETLARRSLEEGAGVITADIASGEAPGQRLPNRFWIPEMPDAETRDWKTQLKIGHEFYLANTLPTLKRRFSPSGKPNQ